MLSEFRYHITTGEWVLFAPKRDARKKPSDFKPKKDSVSQKKSLLSSCPFEHPQASGNEEPYFFFSPNGRASSWTLQVLPNKFPALSRDNVTTSPTIKKELYHSTDGIGYHDLIITRSHDKPFYLLSASAATDVLRAYALRYRMYAADPQCAYASLFHNWGPLAGASLYHPHYQLIALPLVPYTITHALSVSKKYYQTHARCVHCDVIRAEKKEKVRVIRENAHAIALAPFASKEPYQVTILPKKHSAFFEDADDKTMSAVSCLLSWVMKQIPRACAHSDLNFFIHTAPMRNKKSHTHYHWHIDVVPKLNISAGFELGTGIEINPIFPEEAARDMREN